MSQPHQNRVVVLWTGSRTLEGGMRRLRESATLGGRGLTWLIAALALASLPCVSSDGVRGGFSANQASSYFNFFLGTGRDANGDAQLYQYENMIDNSYSQNSRQDKYNFNKQPTCLFRGSYEAALRALNWPLPVELCELYQIIMPLYDFAAATSLTEQASPTTKASNCYVSGGTLTFNDDPSTITYTTSFNSSV